MPGPQSNAAHANGASPAPSPGGDRVVPLRTGWWLAVLLACTAGMSLYGLGGGAGFEPIDCWVAQTAREMLEAGEWLIPRFSGEVRMQKSPGPYWAVMLTSIACGQPVGELTARLPNVAAAVVLVGTVFWLARRIGGNRAAIFAGFAASASVLVLWWSHRAASDFGLTALTTLSLAAIWIGSECEPPGRRRVLLWLLGYVTAGLGMLYKMPMPLVAVGLPAGVYVVLRWRWRVLRSGWHLVGLVLFLLPWLPWAATAALTEGAALAKWKVEFLDRFTGDLPNVEQQGRGLFLLTYLGPPFLYCLPFSLSLPTALVRAFRKVPGVNRDGALFLVIWFVSQFVFFTAATGKEWRYFLPALPPLFVLLGIELAALFDPLRPATPRRDRAGAVATWVLLPLGLAAGGFGLHVWWTRIGRYELADLRTGVEVAWSYGILALILLLGFCASAWLYLRRHEHGAFAAIVFTMWAMWLWAWPKFVPLVMSQRPFVDFAAQLNDPQIVPPELRPCMRQVGRQDPRITWYGDIRIPRLIDQLRLLEEQGYRRNLDWEQRRYGREMIERLRSPEPILLIAPLDYYLAFVNLAPPELAVAGEPLPPLYLWLQTRYGREDQHYVLFGNRPPPGGEPELRLTDEVRVMLEQKGRTTRWPTSRPAGVP